MSAGSDNLAKEIMKAIDKGGDHTKTIPQAIGDYLTGGSALIAVTYTGVIPGTPPVPDPVVADVLSVTGSCTDTKSDSFSSWVKSLDSSICQLEIGDGTIGISPKSPTKAFKTGLDLVQEDIKAVHKASLYEWKLPEEPINVNDLVGKEVGIIDDISKVPAAIGVGDTGIFGTISSMYECVIDELTGVKYWEKTDKEVSLERESIYLLDTSYIEGVASVDPGKFGAIIEGAVGYVCSEKESAKNPYEDIWKKISEKIVDWLTMCSTGLSFPASNTASGSTGTATVISITII